MNVDFIEKLKLLTDNVRPISDLIELPQLNLTLKLKLLDSESEIAVHSQCRELEGFEYLLSVKIMTLAKSTCEINGVSLENVKYIELTDIDENGNHKKIELYSYLYKFFLKLPATLIDYMHRFYTLLESSINSDIVKNVPLEKRVEYKEAMASEDLFKSVEKENKK